MVFIYLYTQNNTVGDFNSFLSTIDRTNTEISNDIKDMNSTACYQLDLTDIHSSSTQQEQNMYSSEYKTFTKTDNILRHKTSFSTFKKI